jgi:hypothetical protein
MKYLSVTPRLREEPTSIYELPGYSLMPYFDDWNPSIYAKFLTEFLTKYGYSYEEVYKPPYLMTFLKEFAEGA